MGDEHELVDDLALVLNALSIRYEGHLPGPEVRRVLQRYRRERPVSADEGAPARRASRAP